METNFVRQRTAREALASGVDMVASAVGATMGPHGRLALITTHEGIHATKDGVTVANSIATNDPYINMGISMMKDAANKTAKEAGDGTSNTCVIANYLIKEGVAGIVESHTPVNLVAGMDRAFKATLDLIEEANSKIKDDDFDTIFNIALIASNGNTEMAGIITNILKQIDTEGSISIEESTDHHTFSKIQEGFVTGFTLADSVFITDSDHYNATLEDALLYVHKGSFNNELLAQKILKVGVSLQKPIVVVADDFPNKILSVYSKNNSNGIVKIALIKTNSWGKQKEDLLSDFMIALSSTESIVSAYADSISLHVIPKLVSNKYSTSFMIPKTEEVITLIKRLKEKMVTADIQEKAMLQARCKILSGGVASIFVGANTHSELLEKKDRYEDAIEAVKSAIEEGVLPGGGVFHIHAYKCLKEAYSALPKPIKKGYDIFMHALLAPINTNLANKGIDDQGIDINKYTISEGYNLATMEFGDVYDLGILDATKVTRIAITNAMSIAKTILMTETIIK